MPNKDNLLELHQLLSKFNQNAEHPLIWPRLLEALELPDELEIQAEVERKYNL